MCVTATPSRRVVIAGVAASLVPLPSHAQQPSIAKDGFRILEARRTSLRLLPQPAAETACYGFDGVAPGPVLRVKQDEDVRVRLVNKLDQPTTLHWHGLRGENAVDGVGGLTQPPVAPGASFDYAFKARDSGVYLYRPHAPSTMVDQISRGLSGVLIVEESSPPEIDRDLVVVMQDFALDAQGGFVAAPKPPRLEARVGEHLTANLAAAPLVETVSPGARVRLRIVNACAARIAIATFAGGQPFCIAIDGQPCEPFNLVRNTAPIAPGARFDFLLDAPAREGDALSLGLWTGQDKPLQPFLALKAQGAATSVKRAPVKSLAMNGRLPPEIRLGEAKKVELAIEPPKAAGGSWTINGAMHGYAGKPLFTVRRGTPVSFGFQNKSPVALAMHVHGYSVRLLHDLDDGWEPYWRNAVIVPKNAAKHVALLADAPGKWAVHCDIAEHEAAGLAAWFEVV
ncbi:MAG: multicopper oxidase family protein [Hyphomicrobiales bacterium]|nr:multicopper oxidase family protein [Hyphomicrobiales bacterium]